MSCCVGHRHGSDLALLCLWCRPAAVAPIGPLAWGEGREWGPKKKKKKKWNGNSQFNYWPSEVASKKQCFYLLVVSQHLKQLLKWKPKCKSLENILGKSTIIKKKFFLRKIGVLIVAQWKRIWLGTKRLWVQSLASITGLRIWHCCELCVGHMRLGCHVAVTGVGRQQQLQLDP